MALRTIELAPAALGSNPRPSDYKSCNYMFRSVQSGLEKKSYVIVKHVINVFYRLALSIANHRLLGQH